MKNKKLYIPIVFLFFFFNSSLIAFSSERINYKFYLEIKSFKNKEFLNPKSVYIDKETDEIYIADMDRNKIYIFSKELVPIFSFGTESGIKEPVYIRGDGYKLYISQAKKNYVGIFNYRGKNLGKLQAPKGIDFIPQKIELHNGKIYVINARDNNCLIFDENGNYLNTIGSDIFTLSGLAVSDKYVYLIGSFGSKIIRAYTHDGKLAFSFEGITERGGTLGLPVDGVFLDNYLIVLDAMQGAVFYENNKRLFDLGKANVPLEERLRFPIDIDLDSKNVLYFIDEYRKSLMVFKVPR